MWYLCQANSYSTPLCLLKRAELPVRFWGGVITIITAQCKRKGSKPHTRFHRKLLALVSNRCISLHRIKTQQLLDTRLNFAGFSCLSQYPPHFRGLQLLNGMRSLPGIYSVQYFTTFTFLLSFWKRHLSTIMSNRGDDRPDDPISLGFEMEIWEIVLWSHRLIENQATWLRSRAALFTPRVSAHFPCSQPVVRGASARCRILRVSSSWRAAYTCSPCLPILPGGPQMRGGEPLLHWVARILHQNNKIWS